MLHYTNQSNELIVYLQKVFHPNVLQLATAAVTQEHYNVIWKNLGQKPYFCTLYSLVLDFFGQYKIILMIEKRNLKTYPV